jgi:ankyrin repeat protein
LAASAGAIEICDVLLSYGAKMGAIDDTGSTPMHWATTNQHVECVRYFIGKNARTDVKDVVGRTPLHIAFYFENRGIIQLLLDNHADLSIRDNMGRRPNETVGSKTM